MNKDCQLIFEVYKRSSPKLKFKVGDWVIISYPEMESQQIAKGKICQINDARINRRHNEYSIDPKQSGCNSSL
jgi:hypothetical protein